MVFSRADYVIIAKEFFALMKTLSLVFIPPLAVSLVFREFFLSRVFILLFLITFFAGDLLSRMVNSEKNVSMKHAFVVVSLTWIAISFLGALPFYLSLDISFMDSFFESVSAFTTTGFTMMAKVAELPRTLLFWRSFMQWIGGIGIVVAVISGIFRVSGFKFYLAEARDERLMPNIINTVKLIWKIYIFYTLVGVVFLYLSGVDVFEALNHAMTAIATGGMSAGDISSYGFGAKIVLVFLMILGAVSFHTHYKVLTGKLSALRHDTQFKAMVAILVASFLLVHYHHITSFSRMHQGHEGAFADVFHLVSAISCTGFSISNVAEYDEFSKFVLVLLMIFGGAAGSTAGGIKLIRAVVAFKAILLKIRRVLMPNMVGYVRVAGKVVENENVNEILIFILTYVLILVAGTLVLAYEGYSLTDSLFEVASAQGNVGLSVGIVSPSMPLVAKATLIINMLFGRLEIWAMLMLLAALFRR